MPSALAGKETTAIANAKAPKAHRIRFISQILFAMPKAALHTWRYFRILR
jgi:hypothetical protein